MLYRHVFDKISTEFRGIWHVFVNFAALRRCEISEALTTSCIMYTNWRLKIYIWRLHFSSWLPKGDLRIFLISSPVDVNWMNSFCKKNYKSSFFFSACPGFPRSLLEHMHCEFFLPVINYCILIVCYSYYFSFL